jgi:hypothetical protein
MAKTKEKHRRTRKTEQKHIPSKQSWSEWLTRHKERVFLAIIIVYVLLGIAHFQTELSIIGDNAQFLILGKALATGQGYHQINMPSNPVHTKYPVGFPALLAIFYPLFGLNVIGYKIIIFVLSVISMILLYKWFENEPILLTITVLLLITLNLKIHEYSSLILSETPFLTFVLTGFVLQNMYDKQKKIIYLVLTLVSFGMAYYMRTAGIVLFPALLLYYLFKKQIPQALTVFLAMLVIVLPWQLWLRSQGGASYLHQLLMKNPYSPALGQVTLKELFTVRLMTNLKYYSLVYIPEIILPIFKSALRTRRELFLFLGSLFSIITVLGFILDFYKRRDVKGWYFLGTLAVILLWPEVWASDRFLFGVIPLIIFYFAYFFYWLAGRVTVRRENLYVYLGIFYLFFLVILNSRFKNPQTIYTADWVNYKKCALFARDNLPERSVIVCRKPFLFYLWSHHTTTTVPSTSNDQEVFRRFEQERVTHVVYDSFYWSATTRRYLGPVINRNVDDFRSLFYLPNPDTYLLVYLPGLKFLENQP